jgi:putative ABC transport system permease protein
VQQAGENTPQRASFVLRTPGNPLALSAAVRAELRQLDPALVLRNVRSMEQVVGRSVAQQRFNLSLLVLFASLGLVLSVVGIYGVMAYGVSQHTHEIDLRIALGTQKHDVLRLIVKQGMGLTLAGVAIGLLASWGLTRLLKTLLFVVGATDPLTIGVVALLLTLVALAACWIPARRATKVDPMAALRTE